MSKRSDKFFDDRSEHLNYLPESILLDLARNEACPLEYRMTAVEIMLAKGYAKVNHPDLMQMLAHIMSEKDQFGASKKVHYGPQTPPIAPVLDEKPEEKSAPSASVTTATMFGTPEIPENGQEG